MPEDDLAVYRLLPAWQHRVATARTIPRELRVEAQARLDPQGSTFIQGQQHTADVMAPEAFANIVIAFLNEN